MGDHAVTSYGEFDNAVSTTKTVSTAVDTETQALSSCKTELSNESIFMGPICDSCVSAFGNVESKLSTLSTQYSAISSYLIESATGYKKADGDAKNNILSFKDGNITVGKSTSSGVQTGNANQDAIYNYLSQKGFNDAAISGILANIQHESGFDPTALGDGGTSYGICQWHLGRWDNLKSYCSENNLDVDSVEGQTAYLVWELENNYPSVYEKIKNVPNTEQGAYDAAYEWTVNFEIPDNKEQRGQDRGNTAMADYWPTYSSGSSNTPTAQAVAT